MMLVQCIFSLIVLLGCSPWAQAKTSMRSSKDVNKVHVSRISPELEPESSKKFFKKDYPNDERPKADTLKFGHPYPVVQDTDEYDKDYVKDENSDNGSFKAQETYDRLRAKLAKEKRDLAKALAKKTEEENEFEEAQEKHDDAAHDKDEASKKADDARRAEEGLGNGPEGGHHDDGSVRAAEEAVKKQADVTEKEMKELKDCKEELAAARERLKKLMEELEARKSKEGAAYSDLDDAEKKEMTQEEREAAAKKSVDEEYKEYIAAKEAYEKQKEDMKDLEAKVKVAADKVKKMRDSEDADGGVYPTDPKSHAALRQRLSPLLLATAVATLA
jgi:DNA repair exonuclease SbcCD ATPase subunit